MSENGSESFTDAAISAAVTNADLGPPPTSTTLRASCVCEQFRIELDGPPIRLSICHCFACQKRTGSAFGEQGKKKYTISFVHR